MQSEFIFRFYRRHTRMSSEEDEQVEVIFNNEIN